jgi:hypothetical protein
MPHPGIVLTSCSSCSTHQGTQRQQPISNRIGIDATLPHTHTRPSCMCSYTTAVVAGYMRAGRVEMLPRERVLLEAGDKLVLLSDEQGGWGCGQ